MNPAARIFAVVPAAGSGARMNAGLPKQYLRVDGRTLAEYTLETLFAVRRIDEIVVVLRAGDTHWETLPAALRARVRLAQGGAERADSVLNGIAALAGRPAEHDWVLVHDMARPCVTAAAIDALIDELAGEEAGGLLALPVVDTLKRADASRHVLETVERGGLWRAQTPQMFRHGLLRAALADARAAGVAVTDEAMAIERAGHRPRLVAGSGSNIKVTLEQDLELAAFHLRRAHGSGACA